MSTPLFRRNVVLDAVRKNDEANAIVALDGRVCEQCCNLGIVEGDRACAVFDAASAQGIEEGGQARAAFDSASAQGIEEGDRMWAAFDAPFAQ